MSLDEYNPNDPAFLISRDVDGDLSSDEHAKLEELLAGSETLRSEKRALHAAARLVDRWGERVADIDLNSHAKLAHAIVTGESDDPALGQADELLARWARRSVDVDTEAFTARVLSELRPVRRSARPWRTIFRIAIPTAAAAAVMFAASGWFSPEPDENPRCYVDYNIPAVQSVGAGSRARTVVSFAQPPREQAGLTPRPALIGYMTLGSGPALATRWVDSFPL